METLAIVNKENYQAVIASFIGSGINGNNLLKRSPKYAVR